MTPGEWSATAAWVAILLAGIAAIFAFLQIRDARRIRREIAAPYVIAFFERSEAHMTIIDFVVKNVGQTAASDIHMTITPSMERAKVIGKYPFMEAKAIRDGIKMLVPGQELRLYFDDASERQAPELAKEFVVKITAKDSRRRTVRTVFDLDSDSNQGGIQTEIHGLHWMGHRLKSMEDSLKEIARSAKAGGPSGIR